MGPLNYDLSVFSSLVFINFKRRQMWVTFCGGGPPSSWLLASSSVSWQQLVQLLVSPWILSSLNLPLFLQREHLSGQFHQKELRKLTSKHQWIVRILWAVSPWIWSRLNLPFSCRENTLVCPISSKTFLSKLQKTIWCFYVADNKAFGNLWVTG